PLLILSISHLIIFSAFSQQWYWATGVGGEHFDCPNSIAVDKNGNSYVTGYFNSDNIKYGNNVILENQLGDPSNFFLLKFDDQGVPVYGRTGKGTSLFAAAGADVETDNNNNVFLSMWFKSYVNYILMQDTFYQKGIWDGLVIKYDSNGNYSWARHLSVGGEYDMNQFIQLDQQDNIYVAGNIVWLNITFDSINIEIKGDYYNLYLIKLDNSGTGHWGKQIYGNNSVIPVNIIMDHHNNINVLAHFKGDTICTDSNYHYHFPACYFICRYDASGNLIQIYPIIEDSICEIKDFEIDVNNNIYLIGTFIADSLKINNQTILINKNPSIEDVLILKYDYNLNIKWAKSYNGISNDDVRYIKNGSSKWLYIVGETYSDTLFLDNLTITNPGMFISKIDTNGNTVDYMNSTACGPFYYDIFISESEELYLASQYWGSPAFGAINLPAYGTLSDLVVAKSIFNTGFRDRLTESMKISVYPNPFSEIINISFEESFKRFTVSIYSITGKMLFKKDFTNKQYLTINLFDFHSGYYLLKLETDLGNAVIPVLKI
ncbi:T9SS type A sorting domain-containing protein, partial [candidate division KSB1 bacterium]